PADLSQARQADARDADRRLGRAANPADLGRRRRRLLRSGAGQAGSDKPHLRARGAGRRLLERALAAPARRAWYQAAAKHARPDSSHAGKCAPDRTSAREYPAHTRPADDARARRQRRLQRRGGPGLPDPTRPARRTVAPSRLDSDTRNMTERLAGACSRHPWRTIGAWIGTLVLAFACIALLLPGNLTSNGGAAGNPEYRQAERLAARSFPFDPARDYNNVVIVRSARYTVADPQFRAFVAALASQG